jgi:hypothetical protein
MRLRVGVDEVLADQLGLASAEREREHGGRVGGQAGREILVDHDHTAFAHRRENVTEQRKNGCNSVRTPPESPDDRT